MQHPLQDDFDAFATGLKKELKRDKSNKTLKTWKASSEIQAKFKKLDAEKDSLFVDLDSIINKLRKIKHTRDKLWIDIEEEVQYFGNLHFNDITNEIEAIEE